jgi:hypothetical protein
VKEIRTPELKSKFDNGDSFFGMPQDFWTIKGLTWATF